MGEQFDAMPPEQKEMDGKPVVGRIKFGPPSPDEPRETEVGPPRRIVHGTLVFKVTIGIPLDDPQFATRLAGAYRMIQSKIKSDLILAAHDSDHGMLELIRFDEYDEVGF